MEMAVALREERFSAGATIVRRGDLAERVWIVWSGTVGLSCQFDDRRVALEILQSGDVFGDESALIDAPMSYDARALTGCTVLSIGVGEFRLLLERGHALAMRWQTSSASRIRHVYDRLMESVGGSLSERLATVLVREADEGGVVSLSQALLAELLGVRRSSINRVLREFEEAGLVRLAYRHIDLLDQDGLASIARRWETPPRDRR